MHLFIYFKSLFPPYARDREKKQTALPTGSQQSTSSLSQPWTIGKYMPSILREACGCKPGISAQVNIAEQHVLMLYHSTTPRKFSLKKFWLLNLSDMVGNDSDHRSYYLRSAVCMQGLGVNQRLGQSLYVIFSSPSLALSFQEFLPLF